LGKRLRKLIERLAGALGRAFFWRARIWDRSSCYLRKNAGMLGVDAVEGQLQALLARFPGVDRATDLALDLRPAHTPLPVLRRPKNKGPDHLRAGDRARDRRPAPVAPALVLIAGVDDRDTTSGTKR
jgi:hypothetical protein